MNQGQVGARHCHDGLIVTVGAFSRVVILSLLLLRFLLPLVLDDLHDWLQQLAYFLVQEAHLGDLLRADLGLDCSHMYAAPGLGGERRVLWKGALAHQRGDRMKYDRHGLVLSDRQLAQRRRQTVLP